MRRNGVFPVYSERSLFADFDKNVRRAGMESEPQRSVARIGSKFEQAGLGFLERIEAPKGESPR